MDRLLPGLPGAAGARPWRRFERLVDLTEAERAALDALPDRELSCRRGQIVRNEGDPVGHLYLLTRGMVGSSASFSNGDRTQLKIHVPGDILGGPSVPFRDATETLAALTDIVASRIPLRAVGELFAAHPRLGAVWFAIAQQERTMLAMRVMSLARSDAMSRMAYLLLDLHERLRDGDPQRLPSIELRLTNQAFGDLLGLSVVHVSRVLGRMQREGLFARDRHRFELLDIPGLERLAAPARMVLNRNPNWLPPANES